VGETKVAFTKTGWRWLMLQPWESLTLQWITTVLIGSFKQQIATSDVKYYLKKSKTAPGIVFISLLVKGKFPKVLALRANSVFITRMQL
jgi:hypothetical protein